MATFVYGNAREDLATAQLDLSTATVSALLVGPNYTPSPNGDVDVSDIPPGSILLRCGHLTGTSVVNGIFAGTIAEQDAFINAQQVVALVLYVDTGDDTTSELLYYSSDGPGFPFQPQGFNYAISYDLTQGGFFQV